jgi:hypothetical protein
MQLKATLLDKNGTVVLADLTAALWGRRTDHIMGTCWLTPGQDLLLKTDMKRGSAYRLEFEDGRHANITIDRVGEHALERSRSVMAFHFSTYF